MTNLNNKREIEPNYTNEESRLAEDRLRGLIEVAAEIGVEIFSLEESREEILEKVREKLPGRYDLVLEKLREEGIKLDDLTDKPLLDRMLGIDAMFRFQGKNYIVDVTSGKHTVVTNKEKKYEEMENVYRELGIDRALILRIKEEITEDTILDLFSKLESLQDEEGIFSVVIKYPETSMRKTKTHL